MNRETNVSNWSTQIFLWEKQMKDLLETRRPPATSPAASQKTSDADREQNSTSVVVFKRAEKPTRFLVDEGRYEAICTNVRDPYWVPHWKKYQVRFEFALCGKTTPPLVQFWTCGKDKQEGPVIDGWLLQTLDAAGAQSPSELLGRDFYVDVTTVIRDRWGRPLPRHEWYSVVSSSSLITGEQDLVDIADDARVATKNS